MTLDTSASGGSSTTDSAPVELVTLTIDGVQVSVPKGTLVIRAAELIGTEIPRFCDHPLLEPVGACRQCLVEVTDAGNGKGFPKPQASCTLEVAPGMVVKTQVTSPVAEKAQVGNMEFLLANHPLDCPVCDKGGECPLQNQAMSHGRSESRFTETKRLFAKPVPISSQVLLDRERCVLCQRCTRFSEEIAGDPFIELLERGALQQIGIAPSSDGTGEPFHSYFSGNTIQICPVGALTSADYRFRARPFDLVSTPSITEHDSSGAAIRVDHRRGKVMRVLAGDDPQVNEEWISDKDRFAFTWTRQPDRLTTPLVRNAETGEFEPMSWPGALAVAARGLAEATGVGVLPGGRLTLEDAAAYASLARDVLRTNDIDYRSRIHSAEEAQFLEHWVLDTSRVGYGDLETAGSVVLAGLEPEDEASTVFLRLRKRARRGGRIVAIASHLTRGLAKLNAELIPTAPGGEAAAIASLDLADDAVLLLGERLAGVPGAFTAALSHHARIGWIPRRAGDRTAAEAGCLPNHGGADGRGTTEILAAAAGGQLGALVVGAVEVNDLPDPATARTALNTAFVVSLEVRQSEVTALADVVLPVAPPVEKAGTYVSWDGNARSFPRVLETQALPDARVLRGIADELGKSLNPATTRNEHDYGAPDIAPASSPSLGAGQVVLSTWKQLIDDGGCQDGQPEYRATARPSVLRASASTLAAAGVEAGGTAAISNAAGSASFPVVVDESMVDGVVWAPTNSGQHLGPLGMSHGSVVSIRPAEPGYSTTESESAGRVAAERRIETTEVGGEA